MVTNSDVFWTDRKHLLESVIFHLERKRLSPKKPATLPEVARQRELSGTLENESEAKSKKQPSDAKCKELSGHDIFAAPLEILPQATTVHALTLKETIELGEPASHNAAGGKKSRGQTATKAAKKIHDKKLSELSGHDIFKGDVPQSAAEKHLSRAKLREMSGNDIFADGKVESRDYVGGVRKPPGGESTIALV